MYNIHYTLYIQESAHPVTERLAHASVRIYMYACACVLDVNLHSLEFCKIYTPDVAAELSTSWVPVR